MISEKDKKNLRIGLKEVTKSLCENRVARVIIAQDSEDRIKTTLTQAAKTAGVGTEYIETMRQLGRICGISVGASCAAIIK